VDISSIRSEVHQALLPLHEEWIGGHALRPSSLYGIRINRGGSSLSLHYDQVLLIPVFIWRLQR
jgi:hypothetical protein